MPGRRRKKPFMNRLSMDERQTIIGLLNLKWPERRIARETGFHRATIRRIALALAAESSKCTTAAEVATDPRAAEIATSQKRPKWPPTQKVPPWPKWPPTLLDRAAPASPSRLHRSRGR